MSANLENDKELKELKKPSLEDEFAALKKQAAKKVNKKEK